MNPLRRGRRVRGAGAIMGRDSNWRQATGVGGLQAQSVTNTRLNMAVRQEEEEVIGGLMLLKDNRERCTKGRAWRL